MGNLSTEQHGLSGAEVVKLLEELETAVKAAGLPAESEEEVLECLKPAKRSAGKENPNKAFIAQNLIFSDDTYRSKGWWKNWRP